MPLGFWLVCLPRPGSPGWKLCRARLPHPQRATGNRFRVYPPYPPDRAAGAPSRALGGRRPFIPPRALGTVRDGSFLTPLTPRTGRRGPPHAPYAPNGQFNDRAGSKSSTRGRWQPRKTNSTTSGEVMPRLSPGRAPVGVQPAVAPPAAQPPAQQPAAQAPTETLGASL